MRRALGTKKVGHAGTLDPMATGLLVMGVGPGHAVPAVPGRAAEDVRGHDAPGRRDHDPRCRRRRGADGRRRRSTTTSSAARSPGSVGESMQRPPAFSAVKVGGRKLYEAARKGEALEAAPRPIKVDRFEVLDRARRRRRRGRRLQRRHLRAGAGGRRGRRPRVRRSPHGAAPHGDRRRSRSPIATPPDDPARRCRSRAPSRTCPRCGSTTRRPWPQRTAGCSAPAAIDGPFAVLGPDGRADRGLRRRRPAGRSRWSCWQPD